MLAKTKQAKNNNSSNQATGKPPRAKHISHKKPQTKLRDYFNDIDLNATSSAYARTTPPPPTVSLLTPAGQPATTEATTNSSLDSKKSSLKNLKKELREMMLLNLSKSGNNGEEDEANSGSSSFIVPPLTEKQQLKMKKRMLKAMKLQQQQQNKIETEESSGERSGSSGGGGGGGEDANNEQLLLLKKSPKKNKQQQKLEKPAKKQKPLSVAALKKLERMQRKANKLKFDKDHLFSLPIKKQAKAAAAAAGFATSGANANSRGESNFNSNYFFDTDEYNELDLEALNSLEAGNSGSYHSSHLVFEILAEDGFKVVSCDIDRAWRVIVDRVRKLRQDHKLKALAFKSLSGARMYGLSARATVFMLEQMESIEFCPLYNNRYIFRENANDKWIINLNNCARTSRDCHDSTAAAKKCFDQFYWLASDYRSLNCLNLGQRFSQPFAQAAKALTSTDMCNSLKFRHLKEFSKSALIVKRSLIHGRGLFTLVDLNQGQMIVEYAGEIIRNELCDRREKYYESKVGIENKKKIDAFDDFCSSIPCQNKNGQPFLKRAFISIANFPQKKEVKLYQGLFG